MSILIICKVCLRNKIKYIEPYLVNEYGSFDLCDECDLKLKQLKDIKPNLYLCDNRFIDI